MRPRFLSARNEEFIAVSLRKRRSHWDFGNCDGCGDGFLDLRLIREVVLVITIDVGQSLGLVHRSGRFLSLSLPAEVTGDEVGTAEGSDEDNSDGNSSYSSCTDTVGAIAGGLDNGSTARNWIGDCGASSVGMRYGYNMAWYRRVESRL